MVVTLERQSYTELKALRKKKGPRYSDSFGKQIHQDPVPKETKAPEPYNPNVIYAHMVNEVLADPEDPFIAEIFQEYFRDTKPEPEFIHPGMMKFPDSESGLNYLHNYTSDGIVHMVRSITAVSKRRPFPNAELHTVRLEIEEEARAYDEVPVPLSSRITRYRIAPHGEYSSEELTDMVSSVTEETKERPFPRADLFRAKLDMEEDAQTYEDSPKPLNSRISRYRIAPRDRDGVGNLIQALIHENS